MEYKLILLGVFDDDRDEVNDIAATDLELASAEARGIVTDTLRVDRAAMSGAMLVQVAEHLPLAQLRDEVDRQQRAKEKEREKERRRKKEEKERAEYERLRSKYGDRP